MPIGFAYQLVKDVIALTKMQEAEPIDPGTNAMSKLKVMGIVDEGDGDGYSWVRPHKLFALAEAPNASHEIVWVTDKLRRTKRKVVRFSRDGNLDQILIRRKAP